MLSFSLLLLGIFGMALWRYRSLIALNRELSKSIAEQKKAEEALMYSEKRWRNIVVSTPQIGINLDPQGRIIFANTHFLHLVGWRGAGGHRPGLVRHVHSRIYPGTGSQYLSHNHETKRYAGIFNL